MMTIETCFIHCTINVVSLVILIWNEKGLSSCATKINMNKRGFSQTWQINLDILQSCSSWTRNYLWYRQQQKYSRNHNQVAQQQQRNRGGLRMAASFSYIRSMSTTGYWDNVVQMCQACIAKKTFFLVSCLLHPFYFKIISQLSKPQCPSKINWAWN